MLAIFNGWEPKINDGAPDSGGTNGYTFFRKYIPSIGFKISCGIIEAQKHGSHRYSDKQVFGYIADLEVFSEVDFYYKVKIHRERWFASRERAAEYAVFLAWCIDGCGKRFLWKLAKQEDGELR